MNRRALGLAVAVMSAACGHAPGAGTSGGNGTGAGSCLPAIAPAINHRPAAVVCDGGNTRPLGSQTNACLQDSDCPMDGGIRVCSCAPYTRGWAASTVDFCVASDCRIDSDCACGYCSPTYDSEAGPFYGYVGYYCHTPSDACINDSECDGGYCAYAPQVSHWACGYGHIAG